MRGLARLAVAAVLAAPGLARPCPPCGDLDQSGRADAGDALALRTHLAGIELLDLVPSLLCDVSDAPGAAGSPVDPASRCTILDAALLQRAEAGLLPELSPACALASTAPCSAPHEGVGCDAAALAVCVCRIDASCCAQRWNATCAALAVGPQCPTAELLATGDTGEGNAAQYAVAAAMDAHCAAVGGCSAVILAGDNFYDDGVESVDDPQWHSKFEDPYGLPNLDVPFYAVLGNHDYGPTSSGDPQAQIDYSSLPTGSGPGERPSDRWTMPSPFFDVALQGDLVHLFLLDTQAVPPLPSLQSQLDDMGARVAGSSAVWKIAVGHHPRYTSGDHQLDNVLLDELSQVLNPPGLFAFQQEVYCGADLYLSGHDHDREFIDRGQDAMCPDTHFAISGAGSKVDDSIFPSVSRQLFFDDRTQGFAALGLSPDALLFEFRDRNGALDFCRLIPR